MDITIKELSFHRNGICGEGFYAILFKHDPNDNGKEETFLATVFDEPGTCAVISLDRIEKSGIGFANGNSWRGDYFEQELRKAIQTHKNNRVGPFALPHQPQHDA